MKHLLLSALCSLAAWGAFAQSYTSYFTGDTADVQTTPTGGICLMGGGTEHDSAMVWFLNRANGGDIVVIRASGSDGYNDYLYSDLGVTVNSVHTLVFNDASAANDPYVISEIANAEAIWIAGGNQWNYVDYWRNSPVDSAINESLNNRNIAIGGTSAGMAVLGGIYFTAENGTVTSGEALANPFNSNVTLSNDEFFDLPFLTDVMTDTHYDNPDRKGRQTAFLARALNDWSTDAQGIACDEYTAVCIAPDGIARVFGDAPQFEDYAYFLKIRCDAPTAPETITSGAPLDWNLGNRALHVYRINGDNAGSKTFDLNDWETGTGGDWEFWWVDNGTLMSSGGTNCAAVGLAETAVHHYNAWPNPASDVITIHELPNQQIAVYDVAGQLVTRVRANAAGQIDTHLLPAGLYVAVSATAPTTAVRFAIARQ